MPSVYADRKMLKWLPFQALNEQEDFLNDLYERHAREDKPELSSDLYDMIEYKVKEALETKAACTFTIFENHQRKTVFGHVIGADMLTRMLVLDTVTIAFDAIIDIA